MPQYDTIVFTREAVQFDLGDISSTIPVTTVVDGEAISVLRDIAGVFISVHTKEGIVKARLTQWLVLISSRVLFIPDTPNIQATGTYTVSGTSMGAGTDVGFSYNGVDYIVSPDSNTSPEETAQGLVTYIENNATELSVAIVGADLFLTSNITGAAGNLPITDISTNSGQSGIAGGMTGGQDFAPGVDFQPAIFEVYDDGEFQTVYTPTP